MAPRKGCAVVFFPSFLDGELDAELLHEAQPAVDTKYVSQIWVHAEEIDEETPRAAPLVAGRAR